MTFSTVFYSTEYSQLTRFPTLKEFSMTFLQRPAPRRILGSAPLFFLWTVLFLAGSFAGAQENDTINVAGSGIAAPAFQALVDASGVSSVNVNVNGTTAGVNDLCAGTVDIALTNRPLGVDEEANCTATGVEFIEVPLGFSAAAFVASASNDFLTCLGATELNAVFAPSAVGQTSDWTAVNASYPANSITVVLPPQTSLPYGQVDQVVLGDALRSDATVVEDDAAVLAAVAADPNAVGVVSYASVGDNTEVKLLEYNNPTVNTCVAPSVTTLTDRSYGLSERLFAYVNAASLQKAGMSDLLSFVTSEEGAQAVATAGYVGLDTEALAAAQEIVTSGTVGREFSGDVTAFTIAPDVTGMLNIGGAAELITYTESLTQSLSAVAANLTLTPQFDGVPAGARRFCNGEMQVLFTSGELDAESTANCSANNITPVSYALAQEAVVLVANANSDYLACLTPAQITSALGAQDAAALPMTWSQVDASFPENPIIWVAPATGSDLADILLTRPDAGPLPRREDVAESNADPLYRAAAVANVEGGITYMTWQEYQTVLDANSQGIQLVAVNNGTSCVTPDTTTIGDGTYPYARNLRINVTQASLSDPAVQSLLWFIFSDNNYALFENSGLIGVPFGQLAAIRSELQDAFDAAIEVVSTEEPGATDEPVATSEVDATDEVNATEPVEATDEASATEEVAATEDTVATEEITPEATPES
jgi:phosphate transport system substrate-binding protein